MHLQTTWHKALGKTLAVIEVFLDLSPKFVYNWPCVVHIFSSICALVFLFVK